MNIALKLCVYYNLKQRLNINAKVEIVAHNNKLNNTENTKECRMLKVYLMTLYFTVA